MKRSTAAALSALPAIACLAVTAAPAAHATSPAATRSAGISVSATLPNTLTVAGHRGQPVTIWTKGTAPITMRPLDSRPVRFAGLRTGRAYNVYIGAEKAMTARTMTAAGRIIRATAARGTVPGTMQVHWQHIAPSAVSQDAVRYLVTAATADGSTVRHIVRGVDTATLTGLDPTARYRVTVTPYLDRMRGVGAQAAFLTGVANTTGATPAVVTGADVPAPAAQADVEPVPGATPNSASDPVPASTTPTAPIGGGCSANVPPPAPSTPATPVPAPTPTPVPTPAPSIAPRTQLVCPDGWTDNGANCSQTSTYTYSTLTYTYTVGITGFNDIGHCRYLDPRTNQWIGDNHCLEPIYGNVKDATPSGYEDTGTQWRRKDAPPAGWTDNGSAYERTTAKIEVPA